jgi:heptosyltransferase III
LNSDSAASAVVKLSGIDPSRIERVLIYRLGSLGDTVVTLPSLHLVARTFPRARRLMLTNIPIHAKAPAVSEIIGESGLVDGYISYSVGTRSASELLWLWRSIRSFRPEVLVYLTKSRGEKAVLRDERFFRICGAKKIIGLPSGDRAINLQIGEYLWESEAARLARCVSDLGSIDLNDRSSWDLRLTPQEKVRAEEALAGANGQPLIVCGPGTKMQAKDWGAENWRALMAKLSERFAGYSLALVGAAQDRATCDLVGSAWRGHVVNLCGELSPRETAAVMPRAELFLGPDSGPMHFAAGAGVPCVIAFAARTKPGIWFPHGEGHRVVYHHVDCAGCNLETCVEQKKKCLASITVEEMFAAALDAWSSRHEARASTFA